jgi:hypothetical protein
MGNRFIRLIASVIVIILSVGAFSQFAEAYDGNKAAGYAIKHAKSYNANYPKMGADCTNFVSQCVKAGGIKVKSVPTSKIGYSNLGNVFKTEAYWDCQKYTCTQSFLGIEIRKKTDFVWTSTWSIVSKDKNGFWGFYQHMKNRFAKTKEYSVATESELNKFLSDCSTGDILQALEPGKTTKSHSVVVTHKTYDNTRKRWNIKIAYHTTDTAPTDFRLVSWNKFGKDVKWTIINFKTVV